MAEKKANKSSTSKNSGNGKKKAVKTLSSSASDKKSRSQTNTAVSDPTSSLIHQIMPFILGIAAVFLLICFFSSDLTGIIGKILKGLFYGLLGGGAISIPVLMVIIAVFWRKRVKENKLGSFMVCAAVFLLFLSAMIHLWTSGSYKFSIPDLWNGGKDLTGGGVIGGSIGLLLYNLTGSVGAHIIGITGMIFFSLFMFKLTPYHIWLYAKYYIHEKNENRKARIYEQYDEPVETFSSKSKPSPEPDEEVHSRVRRDPIDRHRFEPDVDVSGINDESYKEDDNASLPEDKAVKVSDEDDIPPFDIDGKRFETVKPTGTQNGSKITKLPGLMMKDDTSAEENVDLKSIFSDPDGVDVLQRFADEQRAKALRGNTADTSKEVDTENGDGLEISRSSVIEADLPEEPVKKEYEFPPISLLKLDTTPKNVDISEELHSNASKLVETLRSFKVRTRITNVSRGPTITRYELQPEEGVRVRQIANLVDDIALNLATSGVRIEAPIPGKAAVGVEVPNKTVSTVFLRELIDTETFSKATSKLNVSLGIDVAGDPVFLDIAKMPHLLIAGATGMGKSVCINSLIISLLYKATADEVKLILIDPKKVEFALYSGLPHLLVPVVSDPKKAAGSLQWAVTEMERRFELIEEVGVRDLKGYNAITRDDPEKEFLPQIVIIIDELADLMMTASADVETSICRLAQKARAAGMHLVIGTQRPSVDVITGLIKANIPSRIAFTVSSGQDSRVILDMYGAEKLIGRGDMLYAPVGASKPRRVQGAFVSDSEVEHIVNYIKEHNGGETQYSSEIIESIDRAAASCGNGKKGSAGVSGDVDGEGSGMADPMLRPAIELAIESGKISTSLIQRRLSLGYGRAAKLIDEMQIRGFVSPPEGQKPRTVLITKEQYMEMILDRKEDLG